MAQKHVQQALRRDPAPVTHRWTVLFASRGSGIVLGDSVATDTQIITRTGTERVVRAAQHRVRVAEGDHPLRELEEARERRLVRGELALRNLVRRGHSGMILLGRDGQAASNSSNP